MTSIDPRRVQPFLETLTVARGHADAAGQAVAQLRSAPAEQAGELLFEAELQVDFMVAALNDARKFPATREADEGVRAVTSGVAIDAKVALSRLHDAISGAGGAGPDELAEAARAAHTELGTLRSTTFKDLALKAVTTAAPAQDALGAVREDGVWRTFGKISEDDDSVRRLFAEIDELGDGHGGAVDPAHLDEEIAIDELTRALDDPRAIDRLRNSTTSGTSALEGMAGEAAAGVPLRGARPEIVEAPRTIVGGTEPLTGAIEPGQTLLTVIGRRGEELPLVAGRRVIDGIPSRDAAYAMMAAEPKSWLVLTKSEDGSSWRLVEAFGAGDHLGKRLAWQGIRHGDGGAVEAMSIGKGKVMPLTDRTSTEGEAERILRYLVDDDASVRRGMNRFAPVSPGEHGLPAAGEPVVDLEIPKGLFGSDRTVQATAASVGRAGVMEASRADALAHFRSWVKGLGGGNNTYAVVRMDVGKYGIVPLQGDGLAIRRLGKAIEAGEVPARSSYVHDVEAVLIHRASGKTFGVDLESGARL